jgi:hypothetical protein
MNQGSFPVRPLSDEPSQAADDYGHAYSAFTGSADVEIGCL